MMLCSYGDLLSPARPPPPSLEHKLLFYLQRQRQCHKSVNPPHTLTFLNTLLMWVLFISGNHFVQLTGEKSLRLVSTPRFNCESLTGYSKVGFAFKLSKATVHRVSIILRGGFYKRLNLDVTPFRALLVL